MKFAAFGTADEKGARETAVAGGDSVWVVLDGGTTTNAFGGGETNAGVRISCERCIPIERFIS